LRIVEKIRKASYPGFFEKIRRRPGLDALPGEDIDLLRPGKTLKVENTSASLLVKIGGHRREIALAEPIGHAARNADFGRSNLEELRDHRVDRLAITAPGPFLIESVDEQCLPAQHSGRHREKRACRDETRLFGGRAFPEQMSFAGAGITQQNDVWRVGKVRERPRPSILVPIPRNIDLSNSSRHRNSLYG
jgi:hypothetical protein